MKSKRKLSRNLFAGAAIGAACLVSIDARADLMGDVISAQYFFLAFDISNSCGAPSGPCFSVDPFTVGPGVESFGHFNNFLIDFSGNDLTMTFNGDSNGYTAASFNGPVFTVVSGNPFDPISSVSGIPFADVSEVAGKLEINLQGLTFDDGAKIIVDFATVSGPATPLPASLPLFAGALGLMSLLGWRRERKAAGIAA